MILRCSEASARIHVTIIGYEQQIREENRSHLVVKRANEICPSSKLTRVSRVTEDTGSF